MTAIASELAELPAEARQLLLHAPNEWAPLPATLLRRGVKQAFATLERLELIELRTLQTAPTVTYQWRISSKGQNGVAELQDGGTAPANIGAASAGPAVTSHEPQDESLFRALLDKALAQARRYDEIIAVHRIGFRASEPSRDPRILEAVKARALSCIRETDALALWGNGLVVLQVKLARGEDAESLAHRILARTNDTYDIAGRSMSVRTCIGTALGPRDGTEPDAVLRHAERALNAAWAVGSGAGEMARAKAI